ncbi:MAG: aspartyl protease family protein [Pyrinomonadaceae bacterium MAG19_C2-C3]|nr:aspartyl protease family protein [Pyrinomonadaceae bacterium MAG19_C2-C3]
MATLPLRFTDFSRRCFACFINHPFDKLHRLMCVLMLGVQLLFAPAAFGVVIDDNGKLFKHAEHSLRAGRFAEAEQAYRQFLSANEKHSPARLGLSAALLKQRKLQEAFDEAVTVATREPKSSRAIALIGMTLLTSGDFPRAREYFTRAVQLDEREALAIAGLGLIDYYESRLEASRRLLRRAVQLAPREPDYVFSLAQAASRAEHYREAADAYEIFLRISPTADEDRRARIRGLIQFLRFVSTQGELYQAGGARRSVVKFELLNNRPIVQMRVNNREEPLRFVLDSGSGMCVISEEAARKMKVSPVARGGRARAVGGDGRFDIVYGFLRELSFGVEDRQNSNVTIGNVPVYIRPFYNKENPVDGYIGLSVLSRHLISVDYRQRLLTMHRDTEALALERESTAQAARNATPNNNTNNATNNATNSATGNTSPPANPVVNTSGERLNSAVEIPVRLTTSGFWSSEINLEGVSKTQNFIIDTGASISVVSEQLATREEMNRYAQSTRIKIHGAAGISENVPLLMLPRVEFNERLARSRVPAVVLDMNSINETAGFEQAGIIGGNVLRHYLVTFDFLRMVMRLEPYDVAGGGVAKPL